MELKSGYRQAQSLPKENYLYQEKGCLDKPRSSVFKTKPWNKSQKFIKENLWAEKSYVNQYS